MFAKYEKDRNSTVILNMRIPLKTGVILLAAVLSVISLTGNSYPPAISFQGDSAPSIAIKKVNLFYLQRENINPVSSVSNFPDGDPTTLKSDTKAQVLVNEARIEAFASHYFLSFLNIHPGLSLRVKIFPFHYFW